MASSTPAAPSVLFRGVGGGREAGGGDGGPEAGSLFAGQPPSARPARGLDLGAGSPFVQVRRLAGRSRRARGGLRPFVQPLTWRPSRMEAPGSPAPGQPWGPSRSIRGRGRGPGSPSNRGPEPREPGRPPPSGPSWGTIGLLAASSSEAVSGLHRGPKGPGEKEQGTDARPRRPGLPCAPAGTRSPRPRTSRARRGSGRGTWRPQRRRRGPPCPPRCAAPRRRRCPPRRSRHSGTGSPAARAPGPPPRRPRPARPRPSRRQAGRSRAGSRR